MKVQLTNRVTMFKTTSAYMADHHDVWSTMLPLQTAMTEADAGIAAIDAAALRHETPQGATVDKADARDDLEDATFLMCEALSVLAHESGDNDLMAVARVTRTLLDRMGEEELSTRATAVLAQANAHKTELVTYQVTQANIDELDQSLKNFNAAKTAPRSAIAERSVHTKSVTTLAREAQAILRNSIDRYVNLFRRTDPDFVAGYKAARVIVDRPASRSARKPEDDKPETPEK